MAAVMTGWAFFRSGSFESAGRLLASLFSGSERSEIIDNPGQAFVFTMAALALCLFAPNSMELWRRYRPAIGVESYLKATNTRWPLRLDIRTAILTAILVVISCTRFMEVSPFLYFEF
jgi:hypothetical protein